MVVFTEGVCVTSYAQILQKGGGYIWNSGDLEPKTYLFKVVLIDILWLDCFWALQEGLDINISKEPIKS